MSTQNPNAAQPADADSTAQCQAHPLPALLSDEEIQALHAQPLTIQIHSRLDAISAKDWARLFPKLPDSHAMIGLTQRCGVQGFDFYSLVICAGNYPILFLPLFSTQYDLLQGYSGFGSRFLGNLAQHCPHLFSPKILGIGFVEGEWGEVGYDATIDKTILQQAWKIAHHALDQFAQTLKIELVAFVDFKQEDAQAIPAEILAQYTSITSYPYGILELPYASVEDYLDSLSKATRKDLRRKLKKAEALAVSRTNTPTPEQLQRIFELYQATVARSNTSFGVQEIQFFQNVCNAVPGTAYTLYHHDGELIGFNLLAQSPGGLVDKYFGMEQETGKALNLYFLSWLENVRYCLENGIKSYLAGPAAEAVKCRLGTRMLPTWIYFRHRNPLLHKILRRFAPHFAYQSPVAENSSDASPVSD